MPSITIYELDEDPFDTEDVTVIAEFSVDIVDNDTSIENPDSDLTQQLDVSSIPGFIGNSTAFQTFETYTGTVNGESVTFTLVQFVGQQYMFLTEGSVDVNDVIEDTNNGATAAAPSEYDELPDFVCFTSGSCVETPTGPRPVETLKVGDMVFVAEGVSKPVRWIGCRHLNARVLQQCPHLRPVLIRKDAIAPNVPSCDVRVSQQHRIALTSPLGELLFDANDVLIPARFLVNDESIVIDDACTDVEFIHVLFDQHELVNVAGLWSESFFLGDTATNEMADDTLSEILELFPALDGRVGAYGPTRLGVLKLYEVNAIRDELCAYGPAYEVYSDSSTAIRA
ncbi:Hint domain-containing protein [Cognatiyoonia sp. IB215446]|uniref:Hint domain-containing protein n=1 Tax=Cognatiyoonia sp. IB215446 TaxID=3097355 RepID=UPI002A16DDF0|nr:Hint domain-containing protein [Cognatiyoonia sp. IB215446]MDX8348579.1 Hint domain-containing protein [Cognatiyoonia sp. IB215446]